MDPVGVNSRLFKRNLDPMAVEVVIETGAITKPFDGMCLSATVKFV